MSPLVKLTVTEFTLLRRDIAAIVLPFALPLALLLGFGSAGEIREPDPELGGLSAFEVFILPIALVIVLTMMAITVFPVTLSTYRERGILRRLATTPVHPLSVLLAQLIVHVGIVAASLVLTATVAGVGYEVAAPRQLAAALGVLGLGTLALYAMGVAVAALAPKATVATAYGMALFFPQLFLGGLMVPADLLPDVLARIGEFTPVGATMHGLQGAWTGAGGSLEHLGVLAVWTVAAGAVATLRFRWD